MIFNCQLECGHVVKANLKTAPASPSEVALHCPDCHGLFHVLHVTSTAAFPTPTSISSAQTTVISVMDRHYVPTREEVLAAGYPAESVDTIIAKARLSGTWNKTDKTIVEQTRVPAEVQLAPAIAEAQIKHYADGSTATAPPGSAPLPEHSPTGAPSVPIGGIAQLPSDAIVGDEAVAQVPDPVRAKLKPRPGTHGADPNRPVTQG